MAFSAQFIEHITTKEKRIDFLKNVFRALKKQGDFICTAYHYDLRKIIKKQSKEGFHKNGIFFRCFSVKEIKSEFEKFFKIIKLHPIDITLPFEAKLNLPKKIGGWISRFCQHVPIVNRFGHLVFIKAKK